MHKPSISVVSLTLFLALPSTAQAFGPTCAAPPVISRFWERLDSLCSKTNQLVGPDAAQVIAYCNSRVPPPFAADSDSDRLNRSAALLSSVGLPTPPPYLTSPPTPNELLNAAARRLLSDEDLEMGAIGNYLSYRFLEESCYAVGATTWAPATCSGDREGQALIQLRRRVVQDIASIPSSYLAANAPKMPPEVAQKLRIIAAILDTITQSIELANLAKRMATDTVSDVKNAVSNPCAIRESENSPLRTRLASNGKVHAPNANLLAQLAPRFQATDPIILAAKVMERLLLDGPSLNRDPGYYILVIEKTIQATLHLPSFSLNPMQRQAAGSLIEAIRIAEQAKHALSSGRDKAESLHLLGQAFLRAVESSVTLSTGMAFRLPQELLATIEALAAGRLETALDTCLTLIPTSPQLPAIPSGSIRLLMTASKLVRVRNETEAMNLLAAQLIPVGPWSEKWLFSLNGAGAKLDSGKIGFSGDMGVGYHDDAWGGYVHGKGSFYRLSSSNTLVDSRRGGGDIDAWAVVTGDRPFALELRGSLGASGEKSETTDLNVASDKLFGTDKSWAARGQAFAGVLYRPDLRFAFGLWLGGGGSYEQVSHTYLMSNGKIDVAVVDSLHAITSGRLRAQWQAIPGWFAVRLRSDGTRTSIKRSSLNTDITGGNLTAENTLSSFTQLEISSRLFLDAELARVMGFVPSIYGGIDYFSQSGDTGTVSATIPVFGAGVRRETF